MNYSKKYIKGVIKNDAGWETVTQFYILSTYYIKTTSKYCRKWFVLIPFPQKWYKWRDSLLVRYSLLFRNTIKTACFPKHTTNKVKSFPFIDRGVQRRSKVPIRSRKKKFRYVQGKKEENSKTTSYYVLYKIHITH